MFKKTLNPDGKTAIIHDGKGKLLGTVSMNLNDADIKQVSQDLSFDEKTYAHDLKGEMPDKLTSLEDAFTGLDKQWEGEVLGQQMHDAGDKNWAQIEWIGWGFEFWAKNNLKEHFQIHEDVDSENKTLFDAHNEFPWDFKTHVLTNARGKPNKLTPLNDKAAIDEALEKYGKVGFVIVEGHATFGTRFEQWRMALKGAFSKAQVRNQQEGRPSRQRKDSFTVEHVNVYVITKEDMDSLKTNKVMTIFKQGRQADGSARKEKYNFDTNKVKPTMQIMF